jgi:hypothetical protein
MNNDDDEWSQKLSWLANNELPQRVSCGLIPDDLRASVNNVDTVTKIAKVLRRNRRAIYSPTKPLLAEIQWFYRLTKNPRCCTELAHGALNDFVDAFNACHKDFADDAPPQAINARYPAKQLRLQVIDNPQPVVESLGSVEVFGTSQFSEGQNGTLSGTVICRAANLESVRIAVRFCKLRLLRKPDRTGADKRGRRIPVGLLQNDKAVEVTLDWVGASQPLTLEIKAAAGAIEMINLPDELWTVLNAKALFGYDVGA